MNCLINLFIKIWKVDAKLPADFRPDIIVAASYAVKKDALTNGGREVLCCAIEHWRVFPQATIAFANSSHCYAGSEKVEERLKLAELDRAGVGRDHILSCGPIVNTITEAEAISATLIRAGRQPRTILLVSGVLHSRSIFYIWKKMIEKYFPAAGLAIATIPHEFEYEPSHPLALQRGLWRWIAANIGRQLFMRIFGLKLTGKIHEPSNLRN